jgi:hypothetical protein
MRDRRRQAGGRRGRRQVIMPLMSWAAHVLQWPAQRAATARAGANPQSRPQFGLEAATRLHEAGVASNRGSARRGECVPGPCTHRPSHHPSRLHPKSPAQPAREGGAEGVEGKGGEVVTRYPYENVRMDHLLSREHIAIPERQYLQTGLHCRQFQAHVPSPISERAASGPEGSPSHPYLESRIAQKQSISFFNESHQHLIARYATSTA